MTRGVQRSLQEYLRGLIGGLIFSIPLLFTMEVWWAGFCTHPLRLVGYIVFTFILLLGYNRFAGLRTDASVTEIIIDSIEEMGIGLLISLAVLFLLDRINSGTPMDESIGKIIIEGMIVAVGVSVGTAQLGDTDDSGDEGMSGDENFKDNLFGQITLAICGAVLFAANVAPTEEVVMLAVEISTSKLIGLVFVSLILGSIALYFSDFRGGHGFKKGDKFIFMFLGAMLNYSIALCISALILWFFGRFEGSSFHVIMAQIIVLAVPTTLGASAGRLLIK